MSKPTLAALASLFGGLSFVSVGGANVLFPSIRHAVVDREHWLDAGGLGHLFALSQAAPGPNVMLSSIVGWQLLGLAGLLVATVSVLLPSSLLAFGIGRMLRAPKERRWLSDLTAALVPLALGLMLASGLVAVWSANGGRAGMPIALAAAATVMWTRTNPLLVMAGGTVCYMLVHALA